jgi:hypothetical protein
MVLIIIYLPELLAIYLILDLYLGKKTMKKDQTITVKYTATVSQN